MTPANDPATYDELLAKHQALQADYLDLKRQLAYLKRMVFGQKRERFVPSVPEEQMSLDVLFETAGAKIPGFAESKETITYDRRKPKKGHGRNPIPDDLHREKHVLDVPASEKVCSCCGSEKKHIGDDVTEELEYKPAIFFVNQYVRPKYACPKCPDNGITTALMPPRPIDKGSCRAGAACLYPCQQVRRSSAVVSLATDVHAVQHPYQPLDHGGLDRRTLQSA